MAPNSPELLGAVLSILRQMARWTQGRLEQKANLGQGAVSRLEHGKNLDRGLFDEFVAILGQPAYRVEGLIALLKPYYAPEEATGSPADLNFRQQQIHRHLVRTATAAAEGVSGRRFRKRLWQFERDAATEAWQCLRKTPEKHRTALVEAVSAFHAWAVVERLCEESAKAASHDVDDAARLAFARIAAAHTPGAVGYQIWLAGYAAAFEGNAIKVAGDLLRSRQVFV